MLTLFQKSLLGTVAGGAMLIALVLAAKGPALASSGVPLSGAPLSLFAPAGGGGIAPGVSTSGDGTVKVKPDIAIISVGALAQAPTATEAQSMVAERVDRILKQARALGIADKDVKTAGYQIQPQYAYAPDRAPRLTGYQASQQIQLTYRKIEILGQALDALTQNDAANTMNVRLTIDDAKPAAADARRMAIEEARGKADAMARAAGVSLGHVVAVSDLSTPSIPVGDSYKILDRAASAAPAATQIPAGDLDVTVRVQVQFVIQ